MAGIGAAAWHYLTPLAIVVCILLTIVVVSYRQTIYAYPSGGGSYIVSKDNLGTVPSLVAGASLLVDYNDVHLDQGNFVRYLIGTRLAYFFTPRILVQSLVQYNNQAGVWTANARFGWLGTAGTGLFIVINDGEEASGFFNWGRTQARSVAVKFTRQLGTGGG